MFKVGITRDTQRADGTSIFDPAALEIFRQAGLDAEFLADDVKEVTAAQAAQYDALCVFNPKVTAATLSGPDRRVTIIARMGVGYDSVDVAACTAHGVILTSLYMPVAMMLDSIGLLVRPGRSDNLHLVHGARINDETALKGGIRC